jgi:hypothetical protein
LSCEHALLSSDPRPLFAITETVIHGRASTFPGARQPPPFQ